MPSWYILGDMYKHTHTDTHRQTQTHTDRQTDRQTHTHTHTHTHTQARASLFFVVACCHDYRTSQWSDPAQLAPASKVLSKSCYVQKLTLQWVTPRVHKNKSRQLHTMGSVTAEFEVCHR